MNRTNLRATGAFAVMGAVIFASIGGAYVVAAIVCSVVCVAATVSYWLAGRTTYSSRKFSNYR